LREAAYLLLRYAGLTLEGERLDGPLFWELRPLDSPCEGRLLLTMPLRAKKPCEQLLIRAIALVCGPELVVEDLGDAPELERFQKLRELIGHGRPPFRRVAPPGDHGEAGRRSP